MIDYRRSVAIALKGIEEEGFSIDKEKYDMFKEICDYLTFMSGTETESLVIDIDKVDNTISLRIGTYFIEIEDMKHVIFEALKQSIGFNFYVAGKGTDNAMLVIDIKFKGFLIKNN